MPKRYLVTSATQTQEEAHDEWLENTTKLLKMFATALPAMIPTIEVNAAIKQQEKSWLSSILTSSTLSDDDTQRANDILIKAMKTARENIYRIYGKGSATANAVCELSYALFEELRLELENSRESLFSRVFSKKKLSEKSKNLLNQYVKPLKLATNLEVVNLDGMTVYAKYFVLIMLATLEERYGINKTVNDYWERFPYLRKKLDGKPRIEGSWEIHHSVLMDTDVTCGYRFNLRRFVASSSSITSGFNRKSGQHVKIEGLPYVAQIITHEYNHRYLYAVALKLYARLYGDTGTIDDNKYYALNLYVNRKLMQIIKNKVAAQLTYSQKAATRAMFGEEREGCSSYATKNPCEYVAESFTIAKLTPSAKRNIWGKVAFEFVIQGPDNLSEMLYKEIKKDTEEFNEHMDDFKAGEEGNLEPTDPKCDPAILRSGDFGYIGSNFEKDSPEEFAIRNKIMRIRNCSFPKERNRKLKRLATCLNILDEIKKKAPNVYNQYLLTAKERLEEKNPFVKYLMDNITEERIENADAAKKNVDSVVMTNLFKLIKDNLDVLAGKFGPERDTYLETMLQTEIAKFTIQPTDVFINPNQLEISTCSISTQTTEDVLTQSQDAAPHKASQALGICYSSGHYFLGH